MVSTHHTDMVVFVMIECFHEGLFFLAFLFENVLLCGSVQLMVNQMCIVEEKASKLGWIFTRRQLSCTQAENADKSCIL